MTPEQIIDLLSLIAARDRRTIGDTDVAAWHTDIGDLAFADAQEAVARHYRESREWIMPVDVRRHVKAIRGVRLEGFVYVPSCADEDTATYLRRFREQRAAVASGQREADPTAQLGTEGNRKAIAEILAAAFPAPPSRRHRGTA